MPKDIKKSWIVGAVIALFSVVIGLLPIVEQSAASPNIKTYGDAIWYAVVTLTTVGYGDFYPKTFVGQLLGSVFVLGSLGILGLLIGQIGQAIADLRERRRLGHHGFEGTDHVFVLGWNDMVQDVLEQVRESERQMVVVTDDRNEIDDIHEQFPEDDVFPLYSGFTDFENLAFGRPEEAFRIYFGLADDTETLLTLLEWKKTFPEQEYVVSIHSGELLRTFRGAGVTRVVSTDGIASALVASLIFEPDVAEFSRDLISADIADQEGHDVQQYLIRQGHELVGENWGTAFEQIVTEHGVIPIGISKRQGESRNLQTLPPDDARIEQGDYLLVVTSEQKEQVLENQYFGVEHGVRE